MEQVKEEVKLKILLSNSQLEPGQNFDLDVEVLLISEAKQPFFEQPVLLHLILDSSHHLHSATTKPLSFNQILSLDKKVELPTTGGTTRIVQPFRLKIPNRALPATFFYNAFGYQAQTSYTLRAYLSYEKSPKETLYESRRVPLVVRQFAQIDKSQNAVVSIPYKFCCFWRSQITKTELQFTYDKLCYYFESDEIHCRISYVRSDQDINASSIGGVNRAREIHPISLTAQFMFELMELKVDQRKIQHSVKIGRPANIQWDGSDNKRLRVPVAPVFEENSEMKYSQSCSGEYFSCKWYLVWVFTFPGDYKSEVKTRVWIQTRDFKSIKPRKRTSLQEVEKEYEISEDKKMSRLDVEAETSSLGSFIRKNTPQDVDNPEISRRQIHNLLSEESQHHYDTTPKKVNPEKEPLLMHMPQQSKNGGLHHSLT